MSGAGAYTLRNTVSIVLQQSFHWQSVHLEDHQLLCLGSQFYVFDSHARNTTGQIDPYGSSILFMFSDMNNLVQYFQQMYPGLVFNISPMWLDSNTGVDHSIPINLHLDSLNIHSLRVLN